jgi:hypothetical protein
MPQAALKLVGGANTNETQAMNENGGVWQTQLVRFFYDPNGVSLVQKLGGWQAYVSQSMPAVVRALWAWEDVNLNAHLAVGTTTTTSGSAQLSVITNSTQDDITPTSLSVSAQPSAVAISGSAIIQITDTTVPGVTYYNSVYIATQISIGGVVLFGLYQCDPDGFLGPDGYTVYATDILGNLTPATANSTTMYLPVFSTTVGTPTVSVFLPNYTYLAGQTFPVLVATYCGGITLYGNYIVQSLIDVNNFTIIASAPATQTNSNTMNSGLPYYIYSFGVGTIPSGTGFGAGYFGQGYFGSGTPITPTTGNPIDAIDWTLDNFGQVLIACPVRVRQSGLPSFQPVYQWNISTGQATIITNAPAVNDGVFVAMPQRQVVTWGSTQTGIQDPLLIAWSDVGNYNQWIALVTNQAGSYRIPKGSKIVSCLQGPQQALVLTDVDAWSMQYIGPPYVYSFTEIGTGCGLIGRKAIAAVRGTYFWMGFTQFYRLDAGGVQTIPCPIWDVIFQNLNTAINPTTGVAYTTNIRVAVNSRFDEIQWFYPSASSTGENDSYVKYNIALDVWDYGTLGRSAWVDQSVLGPPIGADPAALMLYQHETSPDAAGLPMQSSFQTGYFALSEGEFKTFVDWVWPDMKWGTYGATTSAEVQITFYVTDYPGDTPTAYGPYTVTQATEYYYTRFRGRLVSVALASSDMGSFWRIGLLRYRFAPDGKI